MVDKSDFLNYTFEIKFPDHTQKFTTEDELASLDSGLPEKSHGMPYFKYNNNPYVYQIPKKSAPKYKPLKLPAQPKFEEVVNKILDYMNNEDGRKFHDDMSATNYFANADDIGFGYQDEFGNPVSILGSETYPFYYNIIKDFDKGKYAKIHTPDEDHLDKIKQDAIDKGKSEGQKEQESWEYISERASLDLSSDKRKGRRKFNLKKFNSMPEVNRWFTGKDQNTSPTLYNMSEASKKGKLSNLFSIQETIREKNDFDEFPQAEKEFMRKMRNPNDWLWRVYDKTKDPEQEITSKPKKLPDDVKESQRKEYILKNVRRIMTAIKPFTLGRDKMPSESAFYGRRIAMRKWLQHHGIEIPRVSDPRDVLSGAIVAHGKYSKIRLNQTQITEGLNCLKETWVEEYKDSNKNTIPRHQASIALMVWYVSTASFGFRTNEGITITTEPNQITSQSQPQGFDENGKARPEAKTYSIKIYTPKGSWASVDRDTWDQDGVGHYTGMILEPSVNKMIAQTLEDMKEGKLKYTIPNSEERVVYFDQGSPITTLFGYNNQLIEEATLNNAKSFETKKSSVNVRHRNIQKEIYEPLRHCYLQMRVKDSNDEDLTEEKDGKLIWKTEIAPTPYPRWKVKPELKKLGMKELSKKDKEKLEREGKVKVIVKNKGKENEEKIGYAILNAKKNYWYSHPVHSLRHVFIQLKLEFSEYNYGLVQILAHSKNLDEMKNSYGQMNDETTSKEIIEIENKFKFSSLGRKNDERIFTIEKFKELLAKPEGDPEKINLNPSEQIEWKKRESQMYYDTDAMSKAISKVYGKLNTLIPQRTTVKLLRTQQKEIYDDLGKFCSLAQCKNIITKAIMQEEYGTNTNQWEEEYDQYKSKDIPDFEDEEQNLPTISKAEFSKMRKEEKTNDPDDVANIEESTE